MQRPLISGSPDERPIRKVFSHHMMGEAVMGLVEHTLGLTGARSCAVLIPEALGSPVLRVGASIGLASDFAETFRTPMGPDLPWLLGRQLCPEGPGTCVAATIFRSGRCWGLLAVGVAQGGVAGVLNILADQIGLTLELAESREALVLERASLRFERALQDLSCEHGLLDRAAAELVPGVADACLVHLIGDGENYELEGFACVDDALSSRVVQTLRSIEPDSNVAHGPDHVMRTGLPERFHGRELPKRTLARSLRLLGTQSYVSVPLLVEGSCRGALTLVSTQSCRPFGPRDQALAEELAHSLSAAIKVRQESVARLAQLQSEDFVAIASHELRTPLAALKLYLESVERHIGDAGDLRARQRHVITKAMGQVDRLVQLSNRLLDVSALRLGALRLQPASANLSLLVLEVATHLADLSSHAGCPLQVSIEADVVGHWDAVRLEQVLTNLISNAIRYAPGSPIGLVLETRPGSAILKVIDHGPGVSASARTKVFRKFARGSAQSQGGLGLGLYLCREIVVAHGGTVDVEDTPGGGATFVVRLPLGHSRVGLQHDLNDTPSSSRQTAVSPFTQASAHDDEPPRGPHPSHPQPHSGP